MPQITGRTLAVTALLVVGLTGCAGTTDPAPVEPRGLVQSVPSETPESAAESTPSADITAPGEVCDPSNMNDPICAAFYPEQVVLNVTARTAEVAGIPDADRIAAAQQACTDPSAAAVYVTAGQLAYCHDQLDPRLSLTIAYYQALGEEGAKADFADKTMPTAEEIGL